MKSDRDENTETLASLRRRSALGLNAAIKPALGHSPVCPCRALRRPSSQPTTQDTLSWQHGGMAAGPQAPAA
eukprot:1672582-Pyramimonas_sp.AAC.1